jgi:hypothetical protein
VMPGWFSIARGLDRVVSLSQTRFSPRGTPSRPAYEPPESDLELVSRRKIVRRSRLSRVQLRRRDYGCQFPDCCSLECYPVYDSVRVANGDTSLQPYAKGPWRSDPYPPDLVHGPSGIDRWPPVFGACQRDRRDDHIDAIPGWADRELEGISAPSSRISISPGSSYEGWVEHRYARPNPERPAVCGGSA